jgi:hypothetical protein
MNEIKTAYSRRQQAPWEDEAIDTSKLPSGWAGTIILLVENGPIDDGDFPSKSARNEMIRQGFAAKVIFHQQEAGTAATYLGRELYCQLVDAARLKDAIAKRQANPNFLNDLWKSQQATA